MFIESKIYSICRGKVRLDEKDSHQERISHKSEIGESRRRRVVELVTASCGVGNSVPWSPQLLLFTGKLSIFARRPILLRRFYWVFLTSYQIDVGFSRSST